MTDVRSKIIRFKVGLFSILLLLAVTGAAGPEKKPLTFAVIGDTGTGRPVQFEVARQMKAYHDKVGFEFVLMAGDNIYPNGEPALLKPRFEEPYQELLRAGVKFYAVLGNHDVVKGLEAQTKYEKFNMDGHRYYKFKKGVGLFDFLKGEGLIEFFALDTTEMNAAQLAWLGESLTGSKARWKVAFMHKPLYSSAAKHGSTKSLRPLLEPLLVRYKVDVVFAGHDHVYERIKPQQGIYHFVTGTGGSLRRGNINRKSRLFAAGNDETNSFLIVEVGESQMKVECIGANGAVLDSVTIEKKD